MEFFLNIFQISKLLIFLICLIFIDQTIATTPIKISIGSVSDLLIQSALDSLNDDLPSGQNYKGGNLISAQKLLQPPCVIYRLTLNLDLECNESTLCPREACAIDVKQHELGVIEVDKKSTQCMPLTPYPISQDDKHQLQLSEGIQDLQEQEIIQSLDKQIVNDSFKLDHEVQDFPDKNDRPFIAVRASHYCPGCPYELNPTLPGLEAFAVVAARSMDKSGHSENKHRVVSIVRVTRSVPPGMDIVRYDLLMEIARTNCLITTPILHSECAILSNEPIQLCLVTFDERPWLQNSRQLIRNNCTESQDGINDLNSSSIQTNLVRESLTNGNDDINEQEEEAKTEIYDQVAQEGRISTYESPMDELPEIPLTTTENENQQMQIELTERPFVQIILNQEDIEKKPVTKGFTDKKKEFDEFLKDFDIPIKITEVKPTHHGPEVTEEIIHVERNKPTVKVSIKKRSINSGNPERKFVLKLAQKSMVFLDEIDKDDKKRVIVDVLEATKYEAVPQGTIYKITILATSTNCPESQKNVKNCIYESTEPIKVCKMRIYSNDRNPLESGKVLESQCYDRNEKRTKRSSQGPVLGGPKHLTVNDPNVKKFVQQGLKKFSAESDSSNEPIAVEIVEATRQVVSGFLYKIKVKLGESTCPKGQGGQTCSLVDNSPIKNCSIEVWLKSWMTSDPTQIKINCDSNNQRKKRSLRGVNYSATMLDIAKEVKDEREFAAFQTKYRKVYHSEEEKAERLRIFKLNMRIAETLQEYEQGTATYGASIFADLTPGEFRQHLGLRQDLKSSENEIPLKMAEIPDIELPTEFDWRHYNVVTPVKDQGSCGSCWAFSVTGNIEGQYAIKHQQLLSLSEQELVDCDKIDEGCNGGLQESAYRALEQLGGLELESDYPYDGKDEKCHFKKDKARVQVISAVNITSNETQMAQWLVKNGPMAIGINANAMQLYMGGVSHPFKFLCNKNNLDHGVLIVGYGIHTYPIFNKKMPYWIIKNSWGTGWGEQGYYRVYRGDGTCGLNTDVSSGIVA